MALNCGRRSVSAACSIVGSNNVWGNSVGVNALLVILLPTTSCAHVAERGTMLIAKAIANLLIVVLFVIFVAILVAKLAVY